MPDDCATKIKCLRDRAREIRKLADGMKNRAAWTAMIRIATSYEQMVEQFEKQHQGGSEKDLP